MGSPWRNQDVDWDQWPVPAYLDEIYREVRPDDDAVLVHHSAFYRRFPAGHFGRSLELGGGPNLYPLMVAASAVREIEVVEPSAASVAYLRRQVQDGPEPSWQVFYRRCRELQPALPPTLGEALARVRVSRGRAQELPAGAYDLASMHFVAESATESPDEFHELCRAFVRAVRPGGRLIAAFMENMGRYRIADGPHWPGFPVDTATVRDVFAPLTDELTIDRVDSADIGEGYETTGMVLLTARVPAGPGYGPDSTSVSRA
ncbi:class I SAM-dependent methyltransferase [Actinoplanes sp. NPDC049596]|uniref:class I SAM-dependent methyltransferase n=1 Tax=unclassified Actinoplanes TaxID=2626549 RepID=UPI003413E7F5